MNVKFAVAVIVGLVLLLISASAQAFGPHGTSASVAAPAPMFDVRMQGCFSWAMVGMDSVINSRLGVPAEHALALSARDEVDVDREAVYDEPSFNEPSFNEPSFNEPLLTMILAAYLWKDSAHSYAIKVFYDCAASRPAVAGRSDFLP